MITALLMLAQPLPEGCNEERAAMLEIADIVAEKYVLANTANTSAAAIRTRTAAGEYDRHCDNAEAFAKEMTRELRGLLGDDHIFVEFAPDSAAPGEEDWVAEWRAEAPAQAFGVKKVERMAENIAYLHLTGFYEMALAEKALGSAFELISGSAGLILDLRNNPGGSPETERPVQWTFMAAGSATPLLIENRSGKLPAPAEPVLTWPRYGTQRPLAILVDGSTFSAPEAVAYSLQAQGRAKIFGAPSGGGAHMLGDAVPLTGGWRVGVPETRPISPHTGSNWESSGVIPDVLADKADAVTAAHAWVRAQLESKRAAPDEEAAP